MAVRLKDIAQDLGVSNGYSVEGAARQRRYRRAHAGRGAQTHARAGLPAETCWRRGLASGRSYAVGLVVPDLVHPFFGEFAKYLGGALRESGLALILASSEEDPAIERQEIRTLMDRGIDVLLVASCQAKPGEGFGGGEKPFLLVDRNFPSLQANFVGADDVAVGYVATRHLIEIGRTKIAQHCGDGTESLGGSPGGVSQGASRGEAEGAEGIRVGARPI